MKNKLVVLNAEEFGIDEKTAQNLLSNLPQILDERNVLELQFSEVIKMDIENSESAEKARELRLLIQKNRTQGLDKWHKASKNYFLRGGQFVDAIKRKEVQVNERMEKDLLEIEKYKENLEKERLEKLQNERVKIIEKYVEDAHLRDFSSMEDDVWNSFLTTKIKQYNDRIDSELKAEKERLEREKAEAERIRLQEIENKRLREEAEARKKEIESERKKQAETLAKEREEKAEIEAKLKEIREKELKAKIEKERLLELELSKGDAEKVIDLIADFEAIKNKYNFKSAKNKKMFSEVSVLIEKVINQIKK